MTTTYELYTNENGTPKAVEGKAPAILERVEALETDVETLETDIKTLETDVKTLDGDVGSIQTAIEVLEGGVVKTINGETPDQTGNIDIPVGHNVGEEWISYTGKIPNGGVPYCGQTVTRATYADLWAYAQAQGLVKTEAEWQSWASSHGGNVPYYSSGNGSTTFRMPKIVGYVKGASSQSESGSYVKEGLPNITGNLKSLNSASQYNKLTTNSVASGALFVSNTETSAGQIGYSTTSSTGGSLGLDASRSNPIYGNSSHVTPETSVVLFGVYAFGEITNQGALDAETLATGLARVESNIPPTPVRYVTAKWSSGTEWYTKYNDGWVEQGGNAVFANDLSTNAVTYPVEFRDTDYTLTIGLVSTSGTSAQFNTGNVHTISVTGFVCWSNSGHLTKKYWRAEGYSKGA